MALRAGQHVDAGDRSRTRMFMQTDLSRGGLRSCSIRVYWEGRRSWVAHMGRSGGSCVEGQRETQAQ